MSPISVLSCWDGRTFIAFCFTPCNKMKTDEKARYLIVVDGFWAIVCLVGGPNAQMAGKS